MKFKDVAISDASTEAKVAALAVLLDKELLKLAETVLNVQYIEGPQGEQGLQGPKGEQGDRGFDGTNGKDGSDGKDGKDGADGKQGVGVQDAKIDFDGSLVITLTDGTEINAGEVVPLDTAEKIRVIGNGGGTSQGVLDAIAALQAVDASYGNMALQNKTSVDIEGGTIDNTVIGGTTPAAGTFTTLIGGSGSANYGQLTGGATTKAVEFKTLGSDTNISQVFQSKGTGAIDLAAGSRGVNISNGGTVTAITRTQSGSGYTSTPSATVTAPTTAGGVQAVIQPVMQITASFSVAVGGTGYTVGDVLTASGGTSTSAVRFTVATLSGSAVATVTLTGFGQYTVLPATASPLTMTGGTGSGCTVNVVWAVSTFTITNAGSGYVEQPTVSFSGGGGSGAAAYATVGSGTVIRSLGATVGFFTPGGISTSQPSFQVVDTNTAVSNYLKAIGASGVPYFQADGTGTNISTAISSKGTGSVSFFTNSANQSQMVVAHTASAVNYVQVTGAATGQRAAISAQGSDTNIGVTFYSKGTGAVRLGNATTIGLDVLGGTTSASYNYFQMAVGGTGVAATLSAQSGGASADANVDLALTPKGTGNVRFGTYTASVLAPTGYIEIKDSGGTTRRLLVG